MKQFWLFLLLCTYSSVPAWPFILSENNSNSVQSPDYHILDYDYNETDTSASSLCDDYLVPDYEGKPSNCQKTGPRIAHVSVASYGAYPYQISLRLTNEYNRHFCGASVIHPWLLLSAAHCFDVHKLPYIQAIAGEHNLKEPDGKEQVQNVTHLIVHEKWNSTTYENDIAILVLNEPLKLDGNVWPVPLRKPEWKLKRSGTVSGWGLNEDGDATNVLMFAQVVVYNRPYCTAKLRKSDKKFTDSMICAGGYRDACSGDSGGPLICASIDTNRQERRRHLCGIVSLG